MRILVTGANGFIGKHICAKLRDDGDEIIGWDISDELGIEKVDLQNYEETKRKLENTHCDAIVHCAGNANVSISVQNPIIDFQANTVATYNILRAMQQTGMTKQRFVFLSSAALYGNPKSLPITEEAELNPVSPYAFHKELCEKICLHFNKKEKMNIVIGRIFSAYGEGLKKQIFWDMSQKYLKTNALNMFGTGNESRDFIHVDDVVNALLLLLRTKEIETIYNIASGHEYSISSIVELFAKEYGIPKECISFNNITRAGDPLNWRADVSKLKAIGFSPSVSIEDGIARYCRWLKES